MADAVYSTTENLVIVQKAITDLVSGKRKVRVEYTTPQGERNSVQYTEVSLLELRSLERQMQNDLAPAPLVESLEMELIF